jgi:hypothetical protein
VTGRTVVGRDGRAKAYRPLPPTERAAALEAGIAAYERGDFFEAHELLEPAWMGSDDPTERSLHQGLIKLTAAYVHAVRGNPLGVAKNLDGARAHLADAVADADGTPALTADRPASPLDLDLRSLIVEIDERRRRLAIDPTDAAIDPPELRRSTR